LMLPFSDWLISLNTMLSSSIHFPAYNIILFFFYDRIVIVYIHHIFFVHWSVHEQLGWFHILTIVNTVARNMAVQVSLLYADLSSFRYMLNSDTLDHMVGLFFSVLRHQGTDFHSGCTSLHPH
jgi:hypothetical protein